MLLLDCIESTVLQDIQDSFSEAIGVTAIVVDPMGNPLTAPSAWIASSYPAAPPAAVMICSADVCLGWLIVGNAPRKVAFPDIRTLVFMPMETDCERFGALGFDMRTVRDWLPETLVPFQVLAGELAREMAGSRDEKTAGEEWTLPVRPGYGRLAPPQRMTV